MHNNQLEVDLHMDGKGSLLSFTLCSFQDTPVVPCDGLVPNVQITDYGT